MENSQKSKMMNDIENRLDDFFGEQDGAASPSPPAPGRSLEKLKSAVLSIDWEITDGCLIDLVNEADALLPVYQADQTIHALLRMLRALARYIQKRKAQAHQDAIKRIMSVYASIEALVQSPDLNEKDKKRIVAKEIQAFKKLKQQVDAQKLTARPVSAPADAKAGNAERPSLLEPHEFKQAMSAVEERLNAQVQELKSQLASLQRELDLLRKR